MQRIAILIVLCLTTLVRAQEVRPNVDDLLEAIHKVETGGRVGPIIGDQGRARGPLQIHRGYWKDANLGLGKYTDVDGLGYSRLVVLAYFIRYEPKAMDDNDVETLARLHNGGPNWRAKRRLTDGYWAKIRSFLPQLPV